MCKGAEEKEISTSAKDKAEGTKIAFSVIKKLKTLNKWLEGIVANWDTIAKSGGGGGAAGGNSSAAGGAGGSAAANGTAPAGGAGAANASGAGDAAGGNATAAAGGAGAANGTVKAEGVMEEAHRGSARGTYCKHYMCFYTK